MCCTDKYAGNVKIVNNFNFNVIEVFSGITLLIIVIYLFSNDKGKKLLK